MAQIPSLVIDGNTLTQSVNKKIIIFDKDFNIN